MSIAFACPTCGSKVKALDQLAGKRVKCPECGEVLAVPTGTEAPPSKSPRKPTRQDGVKSGREPATAPALFEERDEEDDDRDIIRHRRRNKSWKLLWIVLPLAGVACIVVGVVLTLTVLKAHQVLEKKSQPVVVLASKTEQPDPKVDAAREAEERRRQEEAAATAKAKAEADAKKKTPAGLSENERAAAADAIKALSRVEASAKVGVNFSRYSELVGDAKVAADEAERTLPSGDLQALIKTAMDAYSDASRVWSLKIRYKSYLIQLEPEDPLIRKYHLKKEVTETKFQAAKEVVVKFEGYNADEAMQIMWAIGAKALEQARSLMPAR